MPHDYVIRDAPVLPDLPLKPKEAAVWLRERGLSHNQQWPLDFFETLLGSKSTPDVDGNGHGWIRFTRFNRAIKEYGLHARVESGHVVIDHTRRNVKTAANFNRRADELLKSGVELLQNSDLTVLDGNERAVHTLKQASLERKRGLILSHRSTERRLAARINSLRAGTGTSDAQSTEQDND